MTVKAKQFIRLVYDADKAIDASLNKDQTKFEQLTLPLDKQVTLIFIDVKNASASSFSEIFQEVAPTWVIDARVNPRLGTLFGSHKRAISIFEKAGTNYVDLFGRLNILHYQSVESNPAIWSEYLASYIKASAQPNGPFFILFDKPNVMDVALGCLPVALSFGQDHQTTSVISC